jgi:hypothetical protein
MDGWMEAQTTNNYDNRGQQGAKRSVSLVRHCNLKKVNNRLIGLDNQLGAVEIGPFSYRKDPEMPKTHRSPALKKSP